MRNLLKDKSTFYAFVAATITTIIGLFIINQNWLGKWSVNPFRLFMMIMS
ncbi:hypothetical protein [Macrococcus brunensis]|nr:hypothetical protein [Macrococcus brunensis]ULG72852.1 hypothetical protein MGG12_04860 [Macrococcus brunensis]